MIVNELNAKPSIHLSTNQDPNFTHIHFDNYLQVSISDYVTKITIFHPVYPIKPS